MGVLPLILAPASPPPSDLLTEVSGGGGREMPGHRRGSHRRPIFVQEAVVGDSGGLLSLDLHSGEMVLFPVPCFTRVRL